MNSKFIDLTRRKTMVMNCTPMKNEIISEVNVRMVQINSKHSSFVKLSPMVQPNFLNSQIECCQKLKYEDNS